MKVEFDYRGMFDLTGRTALVVGAGSGIGRAVAHGLAAFGASVLCGDIDLAGAENTAGAIQAAKGRAETVQIDLRAANAGASVLEKTPQIDVLVSTPSINVRKPMLEIREEEFDRIVDLNLRGTFFLLRDVGRHMAERGRGSMIVFSSIRAQVVEPGQSVYAATKSGVVQLIRTLSAELGSRGVRANAIAPGIVETPLTRQIKDHPEWYQAYATKNVLGRWAQAHEMVGAVVFLASDASSYVTGSLLFVDGGWTAVDGRFQPPLS